MIITLVRHAKVEEEYQGKYNGHLDISLSQEGKRQAKELGLKLQKLHFDKVYCSDLKRAKETLREFHLNATTTFTNIIREKSWGIHEGKSFQEIEETGLKYVNFEQWIDALDGENPSIYKEKIRKYFYDVIAKQNAKNILIVTHGGVISTIFSIVKNISLEEAFSQTLEYGGITTLELDRA
jgi:broad specificity phosphatase PhoE